MTPEEHERMTYLIKHIQVEQDRAKFAELVHELSEMLEREGKRLESPKP